MHRHSLKLAARQDSGEATRLRITLQVVPPGLNDGAPKRALAQRTQAQRALSCRRFYFYGRLELCFTPEFGQRAGETRLQHAQCTPPNLDHAEHAALAAP